MSIRLRALRASLRYATGPRSFVIQKAITRLELDMHHLDKMKFSGDLHYNENIYLIPKLTEGKAIKLTRLVREDARQRSERYAHRANWTNVDPRLELWSKTFVARLLSKRLPFHIQEAYRTPERQEKLFAAGTSRIKKGGNHQKGRAVDIVHSDLFWDLKDGEWAAIGMLGQTLAREMKIELRWGGDWDGDGDIYDNKLFDPAHWELVEGF